MDPVWRATKQPLTEPNYFKKPGGDPQGRVLAKRRNEIMPKYKVEVSWVVKSSKVIEASSEAEARDTAYQYPTSRFDCPSYTDDSFLVDNIEEVEE